MTTLGSVPEGELSRDGYAKSDLVCWYPLAVGVLLLCGVSPGAVPSPAGLALKDVVVEQQNLSNFDLLLKLNGTPEFSAIACRIQSA